MRSRRTGPVSDSSVTRRSALMAGVAGAFAARGTISFAQQEDGPRTYSPETIASVGRMHRTMRDVNGFLKAIGLMIPAIGGVNYYAVSVGGIDALRELEEGRGVDPETFAGLYAGMALPEVARHLNLKKSIGPGGKLDLTIEADDGRLRYKGAAVRMYSPRKLATYFARAADFRSEDRKTRADGVSAYLAYARTRQGSKFQDDGSSELTEMSERFRKLGPVLLEAESAIRTDTNISNVLADASPHYFGLASGGIDVVADLDAGFVDPETMAAVYGGYVSSDFAADFQITPNGVLFRENLLSLYTQTQLRAAYAERRRLLQLAKVR